MAGNWKMNLNHVEAAGVVQKLAWSLKDAKYEADKAEADKAADAKADDTKAADAKADDKSSDKASK